MSEPTKHPLAEAISQLAQVQRSLLTAMEELSQRMELYDRFIVEIGKTLQRVGENQAVLGQNDQNLKAEVERQREAILEMLSGARPPRPGRPEMLN